MKKRDIASGDTRFSPRQTNKEMLLSFDDQERTQIATVVRAYPEAAWPRVFDGSQLLCHAKRPEDGNAFFSLR